MKIHFNYVSGEAIPGHLDNSALFDNVKKKPKKPESAAVLSEQEKLAAISEQIEKAKKELGEIEYKNVVANSKARSLEQSLAEKTSLLESLDKSIKEKEEILYGDFSDLVVPEEWLEDTVRADCFHYGYSNIEIFLELKKVKRGLFRSKTTTEKVVLYDNLDKKGCQEQLDLGDRFAAAINQKIARNARVASKQDDPDFDPLADFRKKMS